MNFTEDTNTKAGEESKVGGHKRGTTSLLRWTGVAGLLGLVLVGAVAMTAAPANAMVRFCTATVCIGQPNGCNIRASTGVVVMVDDGDSFIASDGSKWTCNHGKWVITPKIVSTGGGITANIGNVQGLQVASDDGNVGPTVTAVTAPRPVSRLGR